jgi:hypothetical protein
VVDAGETAIDGATTPPGAQLYVVAPFAVNIAVIPAHIVGELTVILGLGFTITVAVVLKIHPFPSVTVKV